MFKRGGIEIELMDSMEKQLVSSQIEDQHKFTKLARAIDYLNAAANIFEQAGLRKEADDVTEIIEEIDSKGEEKEYPTDNAIWEDEMSGGLADKKTPKDFDPKTIAKGIKVEMEHTNSRHLATEIVMDHLMENPRYYDYLENMEDEMDNDKGSK